ncbi:MAG: hypothetical protein VKK80_16875 [Prochlorothrix sp.]|nr:hypothetical protein [Prochlorothrix sp.]
MSPRERDLPAKGQPNSWLEKRDDSQDLLQRRYYGTDGRAQINIDYSHDHGAGCPHAHDWNWELKHPRQSHRPLTPEEREIQARLDNILSLNPGLSNGNLQNPEKSNP